MSQLKIELLGSPVLRKEADEVAAIDTELRGLIADMFDTMYAAEGIGLAGPQVGVAKRVVVIDLKDDTRSRYALVNPKVVRFGSEEEKDEEGCLSIPGVSAPVARPTRVSVDALNENGQPVHIEADGLLARCLQHEIDHLDGVLFIDHISAFKRSMLLKKYRQLQAEEKEEANEKLMSRRAR